jgi:hypothetical protein
MPVCPPDLVAILHFAVDDSQNLSLASRGADLRRVDDDAVATPGWRCVCG